MNTNHVTIDLTPDQLAQIEGGAGGNGSPSAAATECSNAVAGGIIGGAIAGSVAGLPGAFFGAAGGMVAALIGTSACHAKL